MSTMRGKRLKVAFCLGGQGAATKFAVEYRTNISTINAIAQARKKSYRLTKAIDAYIEMQFKAYADALDLRIPH